MHLKAFIDFIALFPTHFHVHYAPYFTKEIHKAGIINLILQERLKFVQDQSYNVYHAIASIRLSLLIQCCFLFFWLRYAACKIVVPGTGIKPRSTTGKTLSLN